MFRFLIARSCRLTFHLEVKHSLLILPVEPIISQLNVHAFSLDITRMQTEIEDTLKTGQDRLKQLETDLRDVEADIDDAKKERVDLRHDLTTLRSHIQG